MFSITINVYSFKTLQASMRTSGDHKSLMSHMNMTDGMSDDSRSEISESTSESELGDGRKRGDSLSSAGYYTYYYCQ